MSRLSSLRHRSAAWFACLVLLIAGCGADAATQVSQLQERVDQMESDLATASDTGPTTAAEGIGGSTTRSATSTVAPLTTLPATTEPSVSTTTSTMAVLGSLDVIHRADWRCEFGESGGLQVCSVSTDEGLQGQWSCAWGSSNSRECYGAPLVDEAVDWSCAVTRDGDDCSAVGDAIDFTWACQHPEVAGALNTECHVASSSMASHDWSVSCTFTGAGAGGGYRCSGGPAADPSAWQWDCQGNDIGTWLECSGYLPSLAIVVDSG